ncbi:MULTISPECIES: 4-hydroxythreonine-4-phosphate dehydrogenase PdxA [Halocynthiibacter]|uniref:4-hydroxythreonine-4-phosphate dehydrogenase n=1 Tax=Halocynthiibacter halioticoli TaxID=2986804 RepID=A0AAE3IZL8_9RHOB|nr:MULTISPECIES: 4-hydroxythreonine-4-phosphate dehydrogenase PdxA [Halocynthiibacter]MCV6824614.1 4-hydroxythreonine-4-phosphate dehydrogenase PdxA [Halocynthiibacter halioticoli]MCW4057615.1 4-hydroxythreonine-4-phosphate dehydrogenase PdxA [Halocynthiibacter sp. SDUM655004]
MSLAPIALTCGEPAGIGLELAEKAYAALGTSVPFFLIADPTHLTQQQPYVEIAHPSEAIAALENGLPVLPHKFPAPNTAGKADPANARAVVEVIERAVGLVQSGEASAVCTNPINKKALKDGAGFEFPGHTEFLAHLGGVERVVMMLASEQLRVVPTTIHIALKDVPKQLTAELLQDTIRITAEGLRADFGISNPRIAVAGLNPHAGEGGAMGTEEQDMISGVLRALQQENGSFKLNGPLPADTMFHARARAGYDAAVCMYHDQALIPIKTLDFDRGVNVTLGLPFVRTSPDHGTAFDIAGRGIAEPTSLIEALKLAHHMASRRAAARTETTG